MDVKKLTKVHVDLPNHWAVGGESMWAQPIGGDMYELRNVPFHAYDLNFLDVVEAVAPHPRLKPSVRRVVRRSGHHTLRVIFFDATPEVHRIPLLESLSDLHASFEGANKKLFAIDIASNDNFEEVCRRLGAWERQGLLQYETCEARVEGSFDERPEDSAEASG